MHGAERGGLVVARQLGERLLIGESIEVMIARVRGKTVWLRILAPRETPIARAELGPPRAREEQ